MPQKPAFDPSKPFETVSSGQKPAFDPSKPFEAVKPERPAIKPTKLESAIAGAEQGLTLGFGDEIIGGVRAGLGKLKGEGDFKDLYPKYRDEQREFYKRAADENKKSYIGGNIAGIGTTAFIPGAAAIKGAGVAKSVLQGGALSAGASAGASEAELGSREFFTDVAKGTLIGGGLSGLGTLAAKGFNALRPAELEKYANRRALSAAGFMTKDVKDLTEKQQQQIGRTLLDKKVVTAFASLDDIVDRSGKLKESAGKKIGNALSTVDDHVKDLIGKIDNAPGMSDAQKAEAKNLVASKFQFNMQRIGDRIRGELIEPDRANPIVKKELERLSSLADDFSSKDAQTLGFGNFVKSSQGKQTRFASETVPEQYKQDVYRIIKEELEDAVGRTGNLESGLAAFAKKSIGSADEAIAKRNKQALSGYKKGKAEYMAGLRAEDAAQSRLGQANANRTFGLTDYLAGGSALASGMTGAQALAIGALNKAFRKFGASTQAVGADRLAAGIKAVQGYGPEQLADALGSVVSKSPAIAKKYGPILAKAATESKQSLVAVHYSLLKNPDYSKLFEEPAEKTAVERRLDRQKEK